MELLKFPELNINDIPNGLRSLAERIKNGEYGEAINLGWIIQCENNIEYGFLGKSASPLSEFNLLLDLAKQDLLTD